MGRALYRKYRSKKLSEIVGQEHITKALGKALGTGRISHAYLFTGPRGIGKTSIARILAHEVNQLPYDELQTHIDIIEIDAASNRRIDEVRDLREKVHIAPTSAKYKVYIIDEVHMLTREAFNALLKTLEEPPEHVIFILATTEAHKLPETIISRTQHFAFKPIETDKAIAHLSEIAKKEKISIDKDALRLIAEHGGGSFRDSISLLDQISNTSEKITTSDVAMMLGITSDDAITSIMESLRTQNAKALITTLQSLRTQGIDAAILAKQLAAALRASILQGTASQPTETLQLLQQLIEVPASADPYAALEVRLLQAAFANHTPAANEANPPSSHQKKSTPAPKPPKDTTQKNATKPDQTPPPTPDIVKTAPVSESEIPKSAVAEPKPAMPPKSMGKNSKKITEAEWPEVINEIKRTYNTLYGILRMAHPSFDDTSVTLTLAFAFHQKRLNEPKNRQVIADAIEKVCGASPEIICVVGKPQATSTPTEDKTLPNVPNPQKPDSLGNISNIFGGGELLES